MWLGWDCVLVLMVGLLGGARGLGEVVWCGWLAGGGGGVAAWLGWDRVDVVGVVGGLRVGSSGSGGVAWLGWSSVALVRLCGGVAGMGLPVV